MVFFLIVLSKIEINKISRHYAQLFIQITGSPHPQSGNAVDAVSQED